MQAPSTCSWQAPPCRDGGSLATTHMCRGPGTSQTPAWPQHPRLPLPAGGSVGRLPETCSQLGQRRLSCNSLGFGRCSWSIPGEAGRGTGVMGLGFGEAQRGGVGAGAPSERRLTGPGGSEFPVVRGNKQRLEGQSPKGRLEAQPGGQQITIQMGSNSSCPPFTWGGTRWGGPCCASVSHL